MCLIHSRTAQVVLKYLPCCANVFLNCLTCFQFNIFMTNVSIPKLNKNNDTFLLFCPTV